MIQARNDVARFLDDYPEDKARAVLEEYRWPNKSVRCPSCNGRRLYKEERKGKPGFYRCPNLHESDPHRHSRGPLVFTVRTGTILAHSRVSLSKWLYCLTHVPFSRGATGILATALAARIDVTRRTAATMLQLIRSMDEHAWGLYGGSKRAVFVFPEKSGLAQKASDKFHKQPEQNEFLLLYRRSQTGKPKGLISR